MTTTPTTDPYQDLYADEPTIEVIADLPEYLLTVRRITPKDTTIASWYEVELASSHTVGLLSYALIMLPPNYVLEEVDRDSTNTTYFFAAEA